MLVIHPCIYIYKVSYEDNDVLRVFNSPFTNLNHSSVCICNGIINRTVYSNKTAQDLTVVPVFHSLPQLFHLALICWN